MTLHVRALGPRTAILLAALPAALTLGLFVQAAGSAPSARATVQIRATSLGKTLADARGRTLYLFTADKGKASACTSSACLAAWPPLTTTGAPIAGSGAKASLLGTTRRKDGRLQVTYAGHPLYFFVGDKKAGQTAGENIDHFGGEWYAVSAAGKKVEPKAGATTTTPTTTTPTTTGSTGGTGGGGGYGYSG